jgi:hypothetical protein
MESGNGWFTHQGPPDRQSGRDPEDRKTQSSDTVVTLAERRGHGDLEG